MGGKTGTTTQQSSVSIPPEVLARYNSVNARAEKTAEQPFTPYSGEFVAPLTGTQQAGISNINQAQGMPTPYYNAAGQAMNTGYQTGSGLALASAGQVNPEALTGQNINQYMSPYLDSVVGSTMANLRQQQGQEQSQILGDQIKSGAFGGDRGRIAQANLARQQELATGQTVSGLMNQGYGQALQTAQQQQAQQLAASQANRAALAGAGQSLYSMGQGYGQGVAGLGTQAQESALKGAQAQLGAGTVEQQTQQALNTANYNQFLQQQGYPFQVAQFLANIAMGTGALSGTTTNATTTSPQSFFSDRRLKEDVEKIGKTFDGQDIVRYKYKGEPGTRIGLIAQDVEKHHPEAVGLAGGYRTVDYDKATDDAAERGHFAGGGLAGGYSSEGGAVMPEMAGMGFAAGGAPDINSMMAEILNAHQGMYPYGKAGMYGQTSGRAGAYGTSQMQLPSRGLMRAELVRAAEQPGAGGQAMQGLNAARNIGSAYTEGSNALFGSAPNRDNPEGTRGFIGRGGEYNPREGGPANFVRRNMGENPPTTPPANPPATQTAPPPAAETSSNADGGGGDYETDGYGGDFYTGGLVRGHYAMGGLPFSEAGGYIPEGVLNDDERDKNKKAMDSFTPKPAGAGQSGSGSGPGLLGTIGQIGGAIKGAETIGSAASSVGSGISDILPLLLAAKNGGAIERRGYQTAGEVVPQPGLAAAEPPVDDPFAADRAALARLEGGRHESRNPNRGSTSSGPLGITDPLWKDYAPRLGLTDADRNTEAGQNQVYNAWRSGMHGRHGELTGPQANAAWMLGEGGWNALRNADPNANAYEIYRGVAPDTADLAFSQNGQLLTRGMTAAQALEAAATRRAPGLAASAQQAGLAGAQNVSTSQYPRATQEQPTTPSQQLAREVLAASREQRASPNWMQRHQDWLVPLLSGIGAMASSPSRYLGAAVLQGLAGGAQQYASMQNKAEEQNVARQRLTTEQLGAVNQAGQLDVARLRQETEDRRIGLQLYNNWRQNFRQVTLERPGPDGRPVPTQIMQNSQTGAEMTPAQFAQEEARILREYGLTRGQTTTGAVVAAPPAAAPPSQGQGTPTPSGQGQGTPTPSGQGQGTPTPSGQGQGTPTPSGQGQGTAPPPPVAVPPNAAATTPQGQPASTAAAPQGQGTEGQQPPAAVPQGQPAATAAQAGHQQLVNTRLEELHAAEVARDRARENFRVADANNAGNVQSLRDSFTIAENQVRHLTEKTYAFDNGVQYRILPGSVINANPPEPLQPNSARIDPNTAMVQASPVDIGYTSTGGFALPPGTPTQGIQIVSNPREQAVREQSARNAQEFINATQRSEENIPNILRFATALKVLDATGLNSSRADIAQTLRGLGLEAVANSVLSEPNTSAALTAAKTQVYSAIQAASAAFPRTTQSEFGIVNTQGTPNANMTPDAAHQLTAPQLALAMSETQLRQAWQEASNRGVQNFDAFADRWRRQNPPRVFLDSANNLLGNFRGQALPNQFTQGVLYVMPTDRRQYDRAPENLRARFAPGSMFVATNVETNPETRRQRVMADPIQSNVNAFDVYRQAPGFQLYGVR